MTSRVPRVSDIQPGAASSVAAGQLPQATDGGELQHGCSAARTAEPPVAIRGASFLDTPREAAAREFARKASAAIEALTALNACLNRHRSRLTLRQVSEAQQDCRLVVSLMRLAGLRDAARPDDPPGSRPRVVAGLRPTKSFAEVNR